MIQGRTLGKLIKQSQEIAQEIGTDPEVTKKVLEAVEEKIKQGRRHPREPVPKGGISIRAAARKYKIPQPTISYWLKRGYIKILKVCKNWTYIDEKSLLKYIKSK